MLTKTEHEVHPLFLTATSSSCLLSGADGDGVVTGDSVTPSAIPLTYGTAIEGEAADGVDCGAGVGMTPPLPPSLAISDRS